MKQNIKSGFVVAAPSSGSGKTTVTLSLLAALKKRGLTVQPFKTGPDYIDPSHHARVTGTNSYNLDTWMLSAEVNRRVLDRFAAPADVCVVEGVMGLFDGVDGVRPDGSTGYLASQLGLPVVLVVDARSMARSAAALVKGFTDFDPSLNFAGVIWNRVGSPTHRRILDEALAACGGPRVLGAYGREEGISMPERHLGLVTPEEMELPADWTGRLARLAEESVDIDALLKATAMAPISTAAMPTAMPAAASTTVPAAAKSVRKIAVARDRAFCFYYEENFTLLRELGAELIFFKPTEGDSVPPEADALYLGGGYPELHAEMISKNTAFIDGIRRMHAERKPIYAECGGFMTLCSSMETPDGEHFEMAGLFPAKVRMQTRGFRLGYREVTGTGKNPAAGLVVRGHEFHYSKIEEMSDEVERGWAVRNARGEAMASEGYLAGTTLGGYMHLHFGSNPKAAAKIFGLG